MRLMIAALVMLLCANLPGAAAQSSLTKPNNDASLRRGTPGTGGPSLYRGSRDPREPRRGRRPPINGPDAKGKSVDPI